MPLSTTQKVLRKISDIGSRGALKLAAETAPLQLVSSTSRAQLVRGATRDSEADLLTTIRHLYKLNNFTTAAELAHYLNLRALKPSNLLMVIRALLSSTHGVLADEMLTRFLQKLPTDLTQVDQVALIQLIYVSGLNPQLKIKSMREAIASWRVAGTLTNAAKERQRFDEFRLVAANEDRVDVLKYSRFGNPDVADPGAFIRYFPALQQRGYSDLVEKYLSKLLRTYGTKDSAVWIAAIKFNAAWALTQDVDVTNIPVKLLNRLDVAETLNGARLVDPRFDALADQSLKGVLAGYPKLDVYAKDKLLRLLVRMEMPDKAADLAGKDVDLPDTVLSAHNAIGMVYLLAGDYVGARDRFSRTLREDPSDSYAAQGLRFTAPRTGGSPQSMIAIRDQIGYGITSAGRVGSSTKIGSEKIISMMFAGDYAGGLFGKRHAAHWKLLKRVYGAKFLSYENIPFKNASDRHLFIMGDEGVSDEVRTAQYYGFLIEKFRKVTISCDPRLVSIFQRTWPQAEFIGVERIRKGVKRTTELPTDRINNLDLKLSQYLTEECRPAMDSADYITFGQNLFFNHFAGRIPRPKPGPYLAAAKAEIETKSNLKIGLQWRSGFMSTWRKLLYVDLKDFAPLLKIEGVEFWALQHQMNDEEIEFCRNNGIKLAEGVDLYDDFEAIAAYTSAMDLMVGLSSLPMEMACAVGTQTWMLGFSPENYYLRTAGGTTLEDQLSLNSQVIAPRWIDFSSPVDECVSLVMQDVRDRIETALS